MDTSSGRVGIGDSSPSYNLDINGNLRSTGAATFESSTTTGYRSTSVYERTWSSYISGRGSGAGDDFYKLATISPPEYSFTGLLIQTCWAHRWHSNGCSTHTVVVGRHYRDNGAIRGEEAKVTRTSLNGQVGDAPDIYLSWSGNNVGNRSVHVWARAGSVNSKAYMNVAFKMSQIGPGTITKGNLAITPGNQIAEFNFQENP